MPRPACAKLVAQRLVAEVLGRQLLAEDKGDQPVAVGVELGRRGGFGLAAVTGGQQERAGENKAEERTTHGCLNRKGKDGRGPSPVVADAGSTAGRSGAGGACCPGAS